jgi:protein TonB
MRLSLPFALPDRRRTVSFVLALAIEALLIFLLLTFGPHFVPTAKKPERRLSSFSLTPSTEEAMTSPDHHAAKTPASASSRAVAKTPRSPIPPVITPTNKPTPFTGLPGVLPIELGAKDISKLKSTATPDKDDKQDQADSRLAMGPGLAPGGQSYYMGDWYRVPTAAEIGPYLPKRLPPRAWGLILCKTAARYHIEDCRSVSEYPAGSGMARAALQMSWQFLIRPPRLDGKTLIGTWVGVKVDTSTIHVVEKADPADPEDNQSDDAK